MKIDHDAVRVKLHELAELLGMAREQLAASVLSVVTAFEANGAGRSFTEFAEDHGRQLAKELA